MIEALQHHINEKFPITLPERRVEFENMVGFIPMFPVPSSRYNTASLMGGWELSRFPLRRHINSARRSQLMIILEPKVCCSLFGSIFRTFQTQIDLIGEGPFSTLINCNNTLL